MKTKVTYRWEANPLSTFKHLALVSIASTGLALAGCTSSITTNDMGSPYLQERDRLAMQPSSEMLTENDGPYAFYLDNYSTLDLFWLCMGEIINYQQPIEIEIPVECGYQKSVQANPPARVVEQVRFDAPKIAAIADIHGQFQLLIDLLRNNGVITDTWDWNFGDGHLVIAGDTFDRGPQQTEALWLLYQLDQQAKAVGGHVHMLLGNHETMVLYNDLRYLHPKYLNTAERFGRRFPELYGRDTVLGAWLHTRPVIVTVNKIAFMHAGLHPDYAELNMSVEEVNEAYRQSLGIPRRMLRGRPVLDFLYSSIGPLWYRGYFRDSDPITDSLLETVLTSLDVEHIVVGHTSFPGVFSHWGGRVFNIDADMKRGRSGELLFWHNGEFSVGTLDGTRTEVPTWLNP